MKPKKKTTTFLLCLFLGPYGVHRYYVGKIGTGILYTCTCGLLGIGWLVDLVAILTGRFTDKYGRPLLVKLTGDTLYYRAVEVVRSSGIASASLLERRLLLDFQEASALMSRMEQDGIVSPFDGVHPRKVYDFPTSSAQQGLDALDNMEGHDFEYWCASFLEKQGYHDIQVTPGSGDQGVDVLAEKDGIRYAIQCKCYSSDLGNTPIQEVHSGKEYYHCQIGVVMTNRHFTQGAKNLAAATGTLLWDRDWIAARI